MLGKSGCERILIVRLSAVGDVVMTTPVAKALRRAYPDSYIAWAVEAACRDLVEGNPYLDEVIVWNRQVRSLGDLRRALRARNFGVAIDFQGLLRSGVVTWLSGARRRVGYARAREGATVFYNAWLPMSADDLRGADLYREALRWLGVPADDMEMHVPIGDADREFAREFISCHGGKGKVVALCPGARWPHKRWTDAGWAGLADALGHDVLPVFLGSSADTGLIERIRGFMESEPVSLVGRTTLRQAAAIIELSDLVISVDTGLLHIADALNRRIVGIFGPTTWDYLGKKDSLTVVAKELSCMPCFKRPTCEGFECMRTITVDEVLSACPTR